MNRIEQLRQELHNAIDSIEDEEILEDLVKDLDGKIEHLETDLECLESIVRDSNLPGTYDVDRFADGSGSWLELKYNGILCNFSFDEQMRLDSISFYREVKQVVDQEKIVSISN